MGIFEAFVVFFISWWVVFLPTLSAGTRSQQDAGSVVPGSERGAPERISWTPQAGGRVRQLWESSADDGRTWQVVFDGMYAKKS